LSSLFRFKGQATGLAGRMRVPFQEIIESQASATLAAVGGFDSAVSRNFCYRDMIRFDHALSVVTGSRLNDVVRDAETHKVHSTLIQSIVEGLDILGIVTADRIEAHIVSEHVSGGTGQPTVQLIGTRFENLRVAGVQLEIDLATDVFDRHDTFAKFTDAFQSDEQLRQLFQAQNHDIGEAPSAVSRFLGHLLREPVDDLPVTNGIAGLSLVRQVAAKTRLFRCYGHVIHVPGFGTIRLAEVGVSALTRSVTMLHVNMGSPVMADAVVGSGEDGGSDW